MVMIVIILVIVIIIFIIFIIVVIVVIFINAMPTPICTQNELLARKRLRKGT